MKIVLKRSVPGLGEAGETKEVSPGFGRNYLLPRGWAVEASPSALHDAGKWRARRDRSGRRLREAADRIREKVSGRTLRFSASGEGGKIFGSITARKISDELAKEGIHLRPASFSLPEGRPIHSPGVHSVEVRLHPEVRVTLNVEVAT